MRATWLFLAALIALAAPAPALGDDSLSARLDGVLDSRALKRARVAVLVERERDGQVLFSREPDRRLTPASNVKILTAMAALSTFGPSHRFETLVHADRAPDAEGQVGRLVVRGGGDPAINSEDWWRVANALRHSGLRRVAGDLVLDDSAFDGMRWNSAWGATSSRAYHAPVGALTANYGSFAVTVTPGASPGDALVVAVDPPVAYLRVVNRGRTGPGRSRSSLVVDRAASDNGEHEVITINGSSPAGGKPDSFYRSVLDPARYAGSVLRMQLEANGIQVDGKLRVEGPVPVGAELHRYEGRPLAEIVRLFVKYSNNAVAESLVKALGAHASGGPGSWGSGTPAMAQNLVSLGLDPEGFSLVDGSGLAYQNKVSPRTLVRALRLSRESFAYGPELVSALPIAARDGTLERRAGGAAEAVRAKTGLLNRVTALSGVARLGDGETGLFSILVNGYRGTDEAAMAAVDAFVAELTRPLPGSGSAAPAKSYERAAGLSPGT